MKTIAPVSVLRPATFLNGSHQIIPFIALRNYASTGGPGSPGPSSSAASKRSAVTPFNDDGHVPWKKLSGAEKTGRAAQQTFNFGFILVGGGLTGIVGYFLYTDVFAPESKVNYFNRAVDRIKEDQRCLELLGDGKKITAHGEETSNNWRMDRPIASTERTDSQGNHHLIMQFHVEGPLNKGSVHIHLTKYHGQSKHQYTYFYLDVKGHQRIYLEDEASAQHSKKGAKLFGIKWS